MEWIKTILPLIGVLIGWLLSESGKVLYDKRQDKKKLKKLLFFLLELRYYFAKELAIEVDLESYITLFKRKLAEKIGIDMNDPQLDMGFETWKPFLKGLLAKSKSQDNKLEYFNENIEKIIIELAEIQPILAYELNGKHNIKERLNKANDYMNDLESITSELPFDLKNWINPKLTGELLSDLDESIYKISITINKSTYKKAKTKILKMKFSDTLMEADKFIDDYINQILEQAKNNN